MIFTKMFEVSKLVLVLDFVVFGPFNLCMCSLSIINKS